VRGAGKSERPIPAEYTRRTSLIAIPRKFASWRPNPAFEIIPSTIEIAAEVSALSASPRDPSNRAIVSTARVHGLKLITSGERIIDSGLVPVIS